MSSSAPSNTHERREYFRIKNKLFMSFEIINSNSESNDKIDLSKEPSPLIKLLRDINKIESENEQFCQTLDSDQEIVNSFIKKMNTKIAALGHYAIQSQDMCNELIDVDLSGGGIRFEIDRQLPISQQIKIEIMLLPQYYGFTVLGRVVNCTKDEIKNIYELAVTFDQIKESDRDAIIGHVFKMQSKQLRAVKESENQSSKDDNIA